MVVLLLLLLLSKLNYSWKAILFAFARRRRRFRSSIPVDDNPGIPSPTMTACRQWTPRQ